MIGSIRRQMQKRGAKIILWLTLFSLAGGTFITFFKFSSRFNSNSLGVVNGEDIGFAEFRRKFGEAQHITQEVRRLYGPQADMVLALWGLDKKPEDYALDSLILEKVVQSAANSLGSQVSKEYLQAKLQDPLFVREFLGGVIPPQAFATGSLDLTVLKYVLQQQGITEDQFEEILVDTMKRALFQRLVEGSLYVPLFELRDAYARDYLKKKFLVVRLPFSEYIKKAKLEKLTDGEIDAYFNAHKQTYKIPERRSARLWSFDADSYGVAIADKDVESAYHKRKRNFVEKPEEVQVQRIVFAVDKSDEAKKVELRRQVQEVLKQAKENPAQFEELAKKHSQSADKGKAITFKRGTPGVVENTAFGLQVNEISPVIETPQGFEIIKLLSKKQATYKPIAAVKDEILKSLKREKFLADFNSNAQRVVSQAKDLPAVFEKFIEEKKGKATTLSDVTRDASIEKERLFGLAEPSDKAFYENEGKGYIIN